MKEDSIMVILICLDGLIIFIYVDRYGHVTETMRQDSANRMQAFIQGMAEKDGGKT